MKTLFGWLLCKFGFCNRKNRYHPYPDVAPQIELGQCSRCGSYDWR